MLEKIFSTIRRHVLFKIMLALCVGVVFCINQYAASAMTASSSLTLNYSQASQGTHINGTRLNLNGLKDTAIMTAAIEQTGLTGLLTPEELSGMISITPRQSRQPEDEYIATEYNVYLTMSEPLGGVSAHDLLQTIMLTYINSVYDQYVGNYAMLDFTVAQLSQLDYFMIAETMQTKADLLVEYMTLRSKEDAEFISTATGESFASLKQKVEELSRITLEKYNAYISNNGLTKQLATYKAQLTFENVMLQNNYDKAVVEYQTRVKAISSFPASQSVAVLIPTLDSAGNFYMSRTKTAVDHLSTEANQYMQSADKTLKRINANQEVLTNISKKGSNSEEQIQQADAMIAQITTALSSLESTIRQTDDEYIRTKLYNSLRYYVFTPSDADRMDVRDTIIVMVAAFVLLVMIQALVETRSSHRKAGVM